MSDDRFLIRPGLDPSLTKAIIVTGRQYGRAAAIRQEAEELGARIIELTPNADPGLVEAADNARLLGRDGILFGTNFSDVLGRRIDPATIRPSTEEDR